MMELRAEHMSWAFLCLWHLGMKTLQRSTPGKHACCSPWSLRTGPLCILLISERKHMCWEVESTLDLAIIQPSEEGNGDPGPFSEEMPAQPLGTPLLLYMGTSHVNYSCKISTVGSTIVLGVSLSGSAYRDFLDHCQHSPYLLPKPGQTRCGMSQWGTGTGAHAVLCTGPCCRAAKGMTECRQ